jgi:hypothetical protein
MNMGIRGECLIAKGFPIPASGGANPQPGRDRLGVRGVKKDFFNAEFVCDVILQM